MLLDNRFTSTSTLYLVINANSVEYGVFHAGAWAERSISVINIEAQNDASQLASAIERVSADIESKIRKSSLPEIEHLSVLVADGWLPSVLTPWNASTNANARLAKLAALNQFNYAGFNVEESDVVKFLHFGYKKPSLAIAYPYKLMASLSQLEDQLALRLISVLPISIASFNVVKAKLPKLNLLGIYTQNLFTVIDASSGLIDVKSRHIDDQGDNPRAVIHAEWNRIKLRTSHLTEVKTLSLLNLTNADIKNERPIGNLNTLEDSLVRKRKEKSKGLGLALAAKKTRSSLDAIAQGYLLTKLHWLAIGSLFILIVVLGAQTFKGNQQNDVLESKVNNARIANTVIPVVEKWTKQEVKQAKAINATIRQLNLPFSQFMEALQPPRDIRVSILSLDLDTAATSKTSHIKMVAEAKTSGEMAQYISFLSQHQIFSDVFLISHEKVETIPEHPYRFNVELTWEDAS